MRRVHLAVLIMLAPLSARAQEWSDSIDTIVVTAARPGPLMWRVTKGPSTLYLLGIVGPVPENLAWNRDELNAALKGARRLLLPPQASVGVVEGLWFLAWNSDAVYLPSDTPMESTLPEALRKRFAAIRERLHRDAERYSSLRVPLAALRLEGDFFEADRLSREEPARTVERMARALGISTKPIANYEALPMLKQLPSMSAAANEVCMTAALDDIDTLSQRAPAAAEAWAVGNLEGVKANYSEERFESCVQAVPSLKSLFIRAVKDSVAGADAALAEPGKTVMVVAIGALLRKDGVLDRLKAQGLTVEAAGT